MSTQWLVSVSMEEDFNMSIMWKSSEEALRKSRMLTFSLKHESCGVKSFRFGKLKENQKSWKKPGSSYGKWWRGSLSKVVKAERFLKLLFKNISSTLKEIFYRAWEKV